MKTKLKTAILLTLLIGANLFAQTFTADSKDSRNQAQFISDAPFEKINGLVSGLDAIVMLNPNDITQKPLGKVKVVISNIKTGIELRDEHLRSEMWLNAAKYPYAEFQLTGIKNPSSRSLNDGQKIKCIFVGKFSVHGVTRDIEVPGTLTYFKESEKTKAKMPGNLLVTDAEFNIKLSDYGIKIPDMVVGKVNDEVKVAANFVASDKNASGSNPCGTCGPNKTNAQCNPCGVKKNMKKDNPCNPCAPKKK
ncbi:YceI family protein [Melioribacteraceae bacterium 4301-Me]|uniref:YceI family protein n=1 Tax=Pyranulibacter aquaticus TaxID=3163344 RepID=UPI00359A9C04